MLTWALPALGDHLIIFHNRRNPSVLIYLRAGIRTPNLTNMAHDCKEQSHKHVCMYEDCCVLSQFIWCQLLHSFVVCPKKRQLITVIVFGLQDSARTRRQGAIIESMHHHGKGVYSGTFSGMVVSCVAALE